MPAARGFLKILFLGRFTAYSRRSLHRTIHFFAYALPAVLALALVFGQRAVADSPYAVDAWSIADGLPESSVITIAQTHDGYLWLGTLNGLVRFDGNSMTPINVNNAPGLPDNVITFLYEDSRTNLWVGTANGGLCVVAGGGITPVDMRGTDGKVILASEEEPGVPRFITSANQYFSVAAGKAQLQRAEFPAELFYQIFHLALPGKGGVMWRLQDGQLLKYRNGQLEKDYGATPWTYVPNPVPGSLSLKLDANVTALCEDRDGNLVVGTHDAGVYWFNASGGYSHISTDRGISHDNVLSLCCDREGNLWAGTDGDGLERISKRTYLEPGGFKPDTALSIATDARGGAWAAFNRHGLTYVLTNAVTNFSVGVKNGPWPVFVDSHQQVWVGTWDEGLFRLRGDSFQPVNAPVALGHIYALFQAHDGKLWVGGQNGLADFDGVNWQSFSQAEGLPPVEVRALAEDENSNLWIGTDGAGIYRMRNGTITNADAPVRDISCLLQGRDGVLWAGTSGHGLARFADGQWTKYSTADGLAVDDVGYLMEDDATNLWLGAYEGLMRIEERPLAELAADRSRRLSCRTFLTRECVGAQPAAARTADGRLLFPTIEGVVSVNPSELKPNTNPPPVVIETVLVDGVSQRKGPLASTWTAPVVLQPENEQLEIHFTALNFSSPKGARFGARFRYQLIGMDKKPVDIGGERVGRFGRLSPGNYTFEVTACNEDGYWNETGATLSIVVKPPFWRKPEFIALSVILFLGALAGTIYLVSTARLKRELRAAQHKEAIEHERARIARDLHDQLGANLTQITLLSEMAETDKDLPGEVEEHAQQICSTARETTRSLDEIVWAVNPSNDTLESLANYACKYAQDYFAMAAVRFRAELPPGLPPIPILPEVRHNVFLAFKEAVNNVVKHAQATEARVGLQLEPGRFVLTVADNGRGLGDVSDKKLRNGLKNMRRRLEDVHGQFDIGPGPDGGTVVRLTVPVKT
jgi:signal transduction histidine kinase